MKENQRPTVGKCLAGGAIGALSTVLLTLLLLLPVSALQLTQGVLPNQNALPVGLCSFAGGFAGGLVSQRKGRGGALISGILAALTAFALLCLGGILFLPELTFSGAGLIGGCLGIGALAGAMLPQRKRPRRRR